MNSLNLVKTLSRNIIVNRNNFIINKFTKKFIFTKKSKNETRKYSLYKF